MPITLPSARALPGYLDELETRLPAVPARVLRLQRTVAGAAYDRTANAVDAITGSATAVLETARTSGATVVGQARAAADELVGTVRTGVATVVGQALAQGRTVARRAESEATSLADAAIEAVETTDHAPGSGTPYEEWTKAELVERAKELGIVGPTRLSKADLVTALRAAS